MEYQAKGLPRKPSASVTLTTNPLWMQILQNRIILLLNGIKSKGGYQLIKQLGGGWVLNGKPGNEEEEENNARAEWHFVLNNAWDRL